MKIAVIGPGAMGLFFAARLQQAGHEVWVLDHRPERAAHLRHHGLLLRTLEGAEHHYTLNTAHDAAAVGPCHLVLMQVKAHQTRAAARHLPPLLTAGGIALTLQNGIGNLESMAAVVGPGRLLAGVTMLGVTKVADAAVRHAGLGPILLGLPPDSRVTPGELAALVQVFQQAGLECQSVPDILAVLWNKLLINAGINPVTALTRLPNGSLPAVPAAWQVVTAAVQEAFVVARTKGLDLAPDPVSRVRQVCQATAANRSSMLQDVLAGRPTEIAAINGQIVHHGQKLQVPTPVNALLTHLIQALESGFPDLGPEGD